MPASTPVTGLWSAVSIIDISVEQFPFGGRVFIPITPEGHAFPAALIVAADALHDGYFYPARDACMEGFPAGSLGIGPRDFDDLYDEAIRQNLACDAVRDRRFS